MDSVEVWRSVVEHSAYEVSSLGRVRRGGRVLRAAGAGRGYRAVSLSESGVVKTAYVHHLVAAAFIGPRPEGLDVCHGPGGLLDNRAVNLRYDTRNANNRDAIAEGTHRSTQRTHCNAGHALTPDNVYELVTEAGDGGRKVRRRCRVCLARTNAATYQRSRAKRAA